MFIDVALPLALPPLTYKIPEELAQTLKVGTPVEVPLRKKRVSGYVARITNQASALDSDAVREIYGVSQELPTLSPHFVAFLRWIADYYHYPLGEVIQSALPPKTKLVESRHFRISSAGRILSAEEIRLLGGRSGKRAAALELAREQIAAVDVPDELKNAMRWLKKNDLVIEERRELEPQFLPTDSFPISAAVAGLSTEQSTVFQEIQKSIGRGSYKPYLLHGITGSGKTEVYLACAQQAMAMDKSVLIMVPEIALTPQLFARVRQRLGNNVAILHSSLTDKQRSEQWNLIHRGIARVALGARSTIFAPLHNLGLIIVDEEHESAFKQEDRLKYNARDMALLRGTHENAVVILGSATPSLESFFQAQAGRMVRLEMKTRPGGGALPKMEIVDMRREPAGTILSGRLKLQIERVLERGKQAVLFLNRRGFSSFTICTACGHVPECPNCSVSLTIYQRANCMRCHYCDFQVPIATLCAECGAGDLDYGSFGTESVESELTRLFPQARTIRIDRETTQKRGELEQRLRLIGEHKVDLVIGTQMIAKGHDFPNIELAAIVNADVSLNVPDFRAFERSYQLFTQVAGRAGRSSKEGLVVLQTYEPDNPAVRAALDNDYLSFCRGELERREAFHYPPYCRLVRVVVSAANDGAARAAAKVLTQMAREVATASTQVVGPAPAVLQKLLNRYRWNFLLKDKRATNLNSLIRTLQPEIRQWHKQGLNITIDVDPVSLL